METVTLWYFTVFGTDNRKVAASSAHAAHRLALSEKEDVFKLGKGKGTFLRAGSLSMAHC